jgi:hypothetical protein
METYRVYSRGLDKLDKAGITARIVELGDDAPRKYGIGAVSLDDISRLAGRMEGEGLLRSMDKSDRDAYKQLLIRASRGERFYWETTRAAGNVKERACSEDFYLMSGINNLAVLQNEDLFAYRKFNFDSLFEFTGTVGAALQMKLSSNGWKHGLPWETIRKNGQKVSSVVTSNGEGELRIFQHDITNYETKDPSGSRVFYRRLGISDKKTVEAGPSTEGYLLVSILKYTDQLGIQPEILHNAVKTARQYTSNFNRGNGIAHEELLQMKVDIGVVPVLFNSWETPVPMVKDGRIPEKSYAHFIPGSFGGYNICIDEESNLVIGKKIRDRIDLENAVRFAPGEMDGLIKGLLYQAARGLGRTTDRHLLDIIDYKYAPNFNENVIKRKTFVTHA